MRRAYLITAVAVAFVLFTLFVPFVYGTVENACRNSPYLIYCTVQGYESLGYHFFGFGAVLVHFSYYFWTKR